MKRLFLLLAIACICVTQIRAIVPANHRTRLNEGWQFIRQDMANIWEVMRPASRGLPESVPLWHKITLPHCFNAEDAVDPDVNYYQGPGWYKTSLSMDSPYPEGRTLLEFEGAGQKTDVYVYTTHVGTHTGGYDAWKVDITEAVKTFSNSEICRKEFNGLIPVAVRCDNSRDTEMIPSDMSDFNLYGGLYRYVNLVYIPATSFERIKIDASTDESGKNGEVKIAASFYQPQTTDGQKLLSITIKDPLGKIIYQKDKQTMQTGSEKELSVLAEFSFKKPLLWDVDSPLLYTCQLILDVNGQKVEATERFGFRHYDFKEKGPFYLNGQRLLLRGTHRHEDHAGTAAAMTEQMMVDEMKAIKKMGANFIRLGHYQQSDIILRLCDELGILVWEEIPWCRGGLGGETYRNQARQMLTNLIEQHYNHPSVILWGLGNENDWPGDFPTFDKEAIRNFMAELHEQAHQLDPQRMTSIRRCEFCKEVVDVYSPSIWAGWYSKAFKDYKKMTANGMEDTQRFLHVEWGGDSHARRHGESNYEGVGNAANTGDWSESYIVRLFDWHLKEQETMPNLTGTAFWTFKDFSTPLRPDNPVPYVNQKGVAERDGTPKESYYVFQSYWSKEPMIHIYGHSWPVRWGKADEKKEVLVYSNCPEAELFVNGISQGKKRRNSQDFPAAGLRWEVPMQEGMNTLKAIGTHKNAYFTDEIKQEYQTAQWDKEAKIQLTQTTINKDTVLIEAQITDKNGIRCLNSQTVIEFDILGDGQLIQNQGTSIGSRKIQAYNGRACIKAKISGRNILLAKSENLPNNFITIFAPDVCENDTP